jgi:antitoxin Phd
MTRWKLENAKKQFSRVVRAALDEGPQLVARRGDEAVVVLSFKLVRELVERRRNLVELMRASPLAQAIAAGELELERRW